MGILAAILLAAAAAASLFSFSCITCTATPTPCSAIFNPACKCRTSPPSPSAVPNIRCTFNTSSSPSSPLFPNVSFARSVQVGRLDLSGNNLDRLPEDFFQQEAVEVLTLKDNKLGEVPAALRRLRSLRTLDMSANAVRALGWEVLGAVAGLQSVDLSGNRLTSLSKEDCRRGETGDLKNLRVLLLARNSIDSLDNSTLSSLSGLRELDLAHNLLGNVSQGTLWPLRKSLQTVDLSNNSLSLLHPLAFRPLTKLQQLRLAHSGVRGQVGQLWFPEHLTRLDLRHCGLTSVRRCRLAALGDLKELDLRENPLECSCDLYFLQQVPVEPDARQNQWYCQEHQSWTAVAQLKEQCEDNYTACPTEADLFGKVATEMQVKNSADSIVISWTLEADENLPLEGFNVRYIPDKGDVVQLGTVPLAQRRVEVPTPRLVKHYVVCLDVVIAYPAVVHQKCHTYYRLSGHAQLAGILIGFVVLVPCFVILAYIFVKDKSMSMK